MRKSIPILIVIITAAGLSILEPIFLFQLWFDLGWRKPVADFITQIGFSTLAAYWGIFWLHIPIYAVAGLYGALLGLYFRKDKWFIPAIIAAFAMLLAPHLFLFISLGFSHPWAYFGWFSGFLSLCWELLLFPFLLFMAWLTSRFRGPKTQNTDDSPEEISQPASA